MRVSKVKTVWLPICLGSEYVILFEHQGSLMQGLHNMHLFMVLYLPKESDLLLDLPTLPDFGNWRRIKFIHFVGSNTHSDLSH